jgi:hypothetical protein
VPTHCSWSASAGSWKSCTRSARTHPKIPSNDRRTGIGHRRATQHREAPRQTQGWRRLRPAQATHTQNVNNHHKFFFHIKSPSLDWGRPSRLESAKPSVCSILYTFGFWSHARLRFSDSCLLTRYNSLRYPFKVLRMGDAASRCGLFSRGFFGHRTDRIQAAAPSARSCRRAGAAIAHHQNDEDTCNDNFRCDRHNSSGFRRALRAARQSLRGPNSSSVNFTRREYTLRRFVLKRSVSCAGNSNTNECGD